LNLLKIKLTASSSDFLAKERTIIHIKRKMVVKLQIRKMRLVSKEPIIL
jgi:hypothetical protein